MLRLKKWLDQNERTLSWLARKCEVSPVAVHYWFIGINMPSFKNREKIHKITGIKI